MAEGVGPMRQGRGPARGARVLGDAWMLPRVRGTGAASLKTGEELGHLT